jgi:hypothetical protein
MRNTRRTPTETELDRLLIDLGACAEAREWARAYRDLSAAWAACDRGDWLLWLAAQHAVSEIELRSVVRAAAACARLALPVVPSDQPGPRRAIEAAERWGTGQHLIESGIDPGGGPVAQAEPLAVKVETDAAAGKLGAADAAANAARAVQLAAWLVATPGPGEPVAALVSAAAGWTGVAAAAAARPTTASAREAARAASLAECAAVVRRYLPPPLH